MIAVSASSAGPEPGKQRVNAGSFWSSASVGVPFVTVGS